MRCLLSCIVTAVLVGCSSGRTKAGGDDAGNGDGSNGADGACPDDAYCANGCCIAAVL